MFDQLVESTNEKTGGRSNKFALVTGLIYVVLLTAGAVWGIMRFNISLAESADAATLLAPPPPPPPPPPPAQVVVQKVVVEVATAFVPPKTPPKLEDVKKIEIKPKQVKVAAVVAGGVPGGTGVPGGVPGGVSGGFVDDDAKPLPTPKPTPKPTPDATPTPKPPPPAMQRVSGGVLTGKAIRKTQPPYPAIAKAARAQGAVQVAVTISEEGRVISAEAVGGHPLLKEAAVQAARQWTFQPTELSGQPVKVQGILTFNFTLQ